MEEATWGRLIFALRTGLEHAVWLLRSRHAPVPTLSPPSSRPRRLRNPQKLLGHKAVTTPMISTHVLNRGGKGVRSPADTV
jgi:hypothetical protein